MKNLKLLFFATLTTISLFSCTTNSTESVPVVSSQSVPSSSVLQKHYTAISLKDFGDSISHARYGYPNSIPPYEIYADDQIAGIAENMIWLQNPDGGWTKNWDWARIYTAEELEKIKADNEKIPPVGYNLVKKVHSKASTTDNRNIYTQINYLAKVYKQIPDKKYAACAERALDCLLSMQHPKSGGFTGADVFAITYNDDVMSGILTALKEISRDDELYGFLPKKSRNAASNAYKKGIDCILKTQIKVKKPNGTEILTAWCQQHDHETLEPIWARTFEPPSIVTAESVKVVRFLMTEENPSKEIKNAIIAACEWMNRDDIRIHGKRLVKIPAEPMTLNDRWSDYEQVLQDDATAPDIWARFYDLEKETPIWCDRYKKFCENFNDMSRERRNGYSYTVTSPRKLVEEEYPEWKKKYGIN